MKIAILLGERTYQEVLENACDIKELYQNFLDAEEHMIEFFDVRSHSLPQQDFDLYIITGSPASAYDCDPWIVELKKFIQEQQNQKMIGICFGHQVIAEALGGKVEKSKKGWNLGLRTMDICNKAAWMEPYQTKINMIFNHQDQVVKLPAKARLLAGNDMVPIQMYSIGNNILSMQGHPEYTQNYQVALMHRIHHVIGSPEVIEKAEESYVGLNIDNNIVRKWVQHFCKDIS